MTPPPSGQPLARQQASCLAPTSASASFANTLLLGTSIRLQPCTLAVSIAVLELGLVPIALSPQLPRRLVIVSTSLSRSSPASPGYPLLSAADTAQQVRPCSQSVRRSLSRCIAAAKDAAGSSSVAAALCFGARVTNSLGPDASRFLAQSEYRFFSSQADASQSRNPLERQRGDPRASQRGLQRPPYGNPYLGPASQASRFPFASRLQNPPAPLFYSANDDFREEEDNEEHDREVADYYALQRSRRDFGAPHLRASADLESPMNAERPLSRASRFNPGARMADKPRGIKSSWTQDEHTPDHVRHDRPALTGSAVAGIDGQSGNRLVDVELASTIHEADEFLEEREPSVAETDDEGQPSIQYLRRHDAKQPLLESMAASTNPRIATSGPAPGAESIAPVAPASPDPPRHDSFFASLYLICIAAVLATFVLVCLQTSAPSRNSKLGDTVYTALHACFYLFAWDTVISVFVALVWLATLRSFAKPLVILLVVAVPVILFSFTLYPFISSYGGTWNGGSLQDRAMRWGSIVPALATVFWIFTVYKGRRSLGRAIEILEFSTRILAACPALVPVGFATLAAVVVWTWLWMLMFTRIFLGGHLSSSTSQLFILNTSTWWQAIFFILMYLWTLGVIAGVQRATTAATVSQWYFHRLVVPAPSSQRVVRASLIHATTTIFGTICFSTLAALAVRLPLLILPRRLSSWLAFVFYSFVPTSVATLTNPLTLTYAAIHSQPLTLSARGLGELVVIGPASTTATLTPRAFKSSAPADGVPRPSLLAYRLAKLLLHATRMITSLAFGFGGWVSTARLVQVSQAGYRGSLYAYVVGLIAGAIGWAVLGAMEGVLGGILDAVLVCWGSEVGSQSGQEFALGRGARYCREAGELLGGGEETTGDEERGSTRVFTRS